MRYYNNQRDNIHVPAHLGEKEAVMKKVIAYVILICVMLTMCACGEPKVAASAPEISPAASTSAPVSAAPSGSQEVAPEASEDASVPETASGGENAVAPTTAPTAAPTQAPQPKPDYSAKAIAAYKKALNTFITDNLFPDGRSSEYSPDFGAMEMNEFQISDIDGDGQKELIIVFITAPMAGNVIEICKYKPETDSVDVIFSAFPTVSIYDNGVILADLSHNQGLAGDALWPYMLYMRSASGSYDYVCEVDAWDRSYGETNYQGESFPAEKDTDGDGVVYLIYGEDNTVLDKAEYESWLNGYIAGAKPIYYEGTALTAENIAAIPEAE